MEPGLENHELAERIYNLLGTPHNQREESAQDCPPLRPKSHIQKSSGPHSLQTRWRQIQGFPWPPLDSIIQTHKTHFNICSYVYYRKRYRFPPKEEMHGMGQRRDSPHTRSFQLSFLHDVMDNMTSSKPLCVTVSVEYCQLGKLIQVFVVQSFYQCSTIY